MISGSSIARKDGVMIKLKHSLVVGELFNGTRTAQSLLREKTAGD